MVGRLLQIARRPISAAKPPLNSEIAAARNGGKNRNVEDLFDLTTYSG